MTGNMTLFERAVVQATWSGLNLDRHRLIRLMDEKVDDLRPTGSDAAECRLTGRYSVLVVDRFVERLDRLNTFSFPSLSDSWPMVLTLTSVELDVMRRAIVELIEELLSMRTDEVNRSWSRFIETIRPDTAEAASSDEFPAFPVRSIDLNAC